MRKIAANIIYPVTSAPLKDAYLVIDDDGKIADLVRYERNKKEIAGLEYYSGILIPGFVNSHCHLELSHLKGRIEQGLGLNHFIKKVQAIRTESHENIEKQMQKALRFMWSRGINGLGNVANSSIGVNEISNSQIVIHNFVELYNEMPKTVSEIIQNGNNIVEAFTKNNQIASLAPHSMYGNNMELLDGLNKSNISKETTTLHFLESEWESQLEDSIMLNYLDKLSTYNRILLVHNLNLSKKLFEQIKSHKNLYNSIYWVVCPKSNRYIKSQLPPISDFNDWGMRLCLGTDSLASNHQLSILEEMKTISVEFPKISFDSLLEMATLNGAKALGMEAKLGSFDIGKQPGVLLVSGFDFKKHQLLIDAEVTRMV